MKRQTITLLTLSLALSACAEANSIYRHQRIAGDDASVIAVDAKQRMIVSQKVTGSAYRRFCAEPSPDVFSVLSQSASLSGSLGLDKTAKTASAALQAAFANSETGSTIARTQTINMLREMMFRSCERYLSGAISDQEFPIILARDQRMIVSVLAIEQLTGAVTAKPVVITAIGQAGAGQPSGETVKLLATKQAEIKTKEEGLATAKEALGKADTPPPICATLKKEKADGTSPLTGDESTKLKACEKAEEDVATATAERDVAQAQYKDLVAASKTGLGLSTASASGQLLSGQNGSGLDQAAAVTAVANSVERIVNKTFDQDEVQLFCFKVLADPTVRASYFRAAAVGSVDIINRCMDYNLVKIESATAKEQRDAQIYGLEGSNVSRITGAGRNEASQDQKLAVALASCSNSVDKRNKLILAMNADVALKDQVPAFQSALGQGQYGLNLFVLDLGSDGFAKLTAITENTCKGA
ncbi:MAG: hypothetical protein RL367_350 [Pseudomonadota bacterium]